MFARNCFLNVCILQYWIRVYKLLEARFLNRIKGQLISKGIFGLFNSSKNQTKKFYQQYYETSDPFFLLVGYHIQYIFLKLSLALQFLERARLDKRLRDINLNCSANKGFVVQFQFVRGRKSKLIYKQIIFYLVVIFFTYSQ